jgi:superfamily II DNA or RNA helicase
MKIRLVTPTKLEISGANQIQMSQISEYLTYRDSKVTFELQALKKNRWFAGKYGEEAYQAKIQELKDAEVVSLLHKDETTWCLSGVTSYFEEKFGVKAEVCFDLPPLTPMRWEEDLPFELYPYQKEGVARLKENILARVEFATGTGKSMCALSLVQQLGLKAVIVAPSTSIV